MVYLGRFASDEEAARAYDRAAIKHRKDKATLNFPHEHGQHQPRLHDDDAMIEGDNEGGGVSGGGGGRSSGQQTVTRGGDEEGGGGDQGHSHLPRKSLGRNRYRGE